MGDCEKYALINAIAHIKKANMKAVVIGAGMMGRAAAYDLVHNPEVERVKIIDQNPLSLGSLKRFLDSEKVELDFRDIQTESVLEAMQGYDGAISCVPYKFNYSLAKAAISAGCNFADLGGNNGVVQQELSLHEEAQKQNVLVVPDCGLAPGLVSILTKILVEELGKAESIHLRVGGLPKKPQLPLNYALVFSVQGLVNECVEPCVALRDGKKVIIPPMQEIESLKFPIYGKLEAFTTSGGTSTLPDTYEGKVKNLDYKTIRYPGHCEKYLELQQQAGDRAALEDTLLKILTKEKEDVVLLRATGEGNGRIIQYQMIDNYDPKSGLTAMMRTTAFPATILLSMIGTGKIDVKGAYTQEHFAPAQKIIDQLAKHGIMIEKSLENI